MRNERGQLVLEVVLLAPLLLVLAFLTFEFGRVFGSWLVVTNAVREGARFGMTQLWCTPGTACASDTLIAGRVAATAQYLSIQTTTPCSVSGNTSSSPATSATLPAGQTSCIAVVRWVDATTGDHVLQVWTVYQIQTLTPINRAIPFLGSGIYPSVMNVTGLSSMKSFQ
jgi:Flp pilus assembly protein TadG